MKPKEVIENLEYAISGECTENFGDFVDEIEMAIEALEKQIPKKPVLMETYFPEGQYECPVCGCGILGLFGKAKACKYCLNCGQKFDWGEEDNV